CRHAVGQRLRALRCPALLLGRHGRPGRAPRGRTGRPVVRAVQPHPAPARGVPGSRRPGVPPPGHRGRRARRGGAAAPLRGLRPRGNGRGVKTLVLLAGEAGAAAAWREHAIVAWDEAAEKALRARGLLFRTVAQALGAGAGEAIDDAALAWTK